MLLKNNFFKNPDSVVEYAKTLDYHKAKDYQNWPGVRTENMHIIDNTFFANVMLDILKPKYGINVRFNNSYLHFHKIRPGDTAKVSFHKDEDFDMAAVIYLSKDVDIDNGTTLFNKDGNKQVVVSNHYNSMILYNAKTLHGATKMKFDTNRLTLVAFFSDIKVAKE